ncbi:hypothetical protein BJ170DRAFT_203187 [Xylariales sp. AK1849]|nr:hypothetical protein BJ170DRAFT_203187 [Xylariales sp. AK1849]
MASPLSPAPRAMLNFGTPPTARRFEKDDVFTSQSNSALAEPMTVDADVSSPFISTVQDDKVESPTKENVSPSKIRHSRILSGTEIAPLKILSPRDENIDTEIRSPTKQEAAPKSPRKAFSPEKRFPVKVSTGSTSPEKSPEKSPAKSPEKAFEKSSEKPAVVEQEITLEDAIQANEGLKQAIQIFEDESTMLENDKDDADATSMTIDHHPVDVEDEPCGPDDTMVSTFSTFSAVPNMTMFARIGHSPTRFANTGATPTARGRLDPSPSRTPRAPVIQDSGNTTSLMDFTEQLSGFSSTRYGPPSPSRKARLSPAKTTGHRPHATPHRTQANLLDFDIPPLPTPRSVPTVTARDVETLKSAFLSEISSLKASLLGKEAEVSSLKTAIGDAEKRVGNCMEELRETKSLREAMAEEKESWEKRGREMEAVLRRVKAEIVMGQREREELESKFDESEKRREAAEIMAQEAESKMAGMRASKALDAASDAGNSNRSAERDPKSPGSREVEIAVERVARELHALYKSKHESKVSALKKSYENRWEKKVRDLERQIDDLAEDNDKLRLGRDATMTKVDPVQAAADEERKAQSAQDSAQIKKLNAEIQQLGAVINSVKQDNQELILLLEKERVEKGELVQLAEEMMSMQHSFVQHETPTRPNVTRAPESSTFRNSVARPGASGLRQPGSLKKSHTESRIGGLTHERTKSGAPQGGLPRPGLGVSARSGIMSSIEKMGSYRGRGD